MLSVPNQLTAQHQSAIPCQSSADNVLHPLSAFALDFRVNIVVLTELMPQKAA